MNTVYTQYIFSVRRQVIVAHCRNNVNQLVRVKQTLNVILQR